MRGDRARKDSQGGRTLDQVPPHLRRFVVDQEYASYTPRDHAVWRHILRRLVRHLADRAHPVYLRGLEATGIGTERIPPIEEMNRALARLGWSAVCVRGFIPPAVFTELQSLRVLAIAADVRTHEHIEYTPAPDIVHESAGHAPILADPAYSAFVQRAGELGFRAIASREDDEVYEAIRHLSVVKEDPTASDEEVRAAERRLEEATAARRFVSEATRASRLYWWTAEYGLVGAPDRPRIYGAGLLSSIGESAHCLGDEVERLPLSVACADVEYDITRMQPQLFVARDLEQLSEVVDELAAELAFRRGGSYGLARALEANAVTHLVTADGLEVSGIVSTAHAAPRPIAPGLDDAAVEVAGPTLLSRGGRALRAPVKLPAFVALGGGDEAPPPGKLALRLPSGLELTGVVVAAHDVAAVEVRDLRARLGTRELAAPRAALLVLADGLPSVAGGPGDPGAWDRAFGRRRAVSDGEARARAHKAAALPPSLANLYREVRAMRERGEIDAERLEGIATAAREFADDWLLRVEIAELLSPATAGVEAPAGATV
jgi:phenylalanine-4-hydroxylase